MNKKSNFRTLTFGAMMCALVFLGTYFRLPIPMSHNGYVHLGDGFAFIGCFFLPLQIAVPAAAIGAGVSDLLGGAAIWLPATLIIKSLMCLAFVRHKSSLDRKSSCALSEHISQNRYQNNKKLNIWTALPRVLLGSSINFAGYFFAAGIMFNDFYAFVPSIPAELVQSVGGGVVFILLVKPMSKISSFFIEF